MRCFKRLQIILSLAAADNLSDARHQTVHSRHGLSVLVQLHIEGLDLLGIIRHKDRTLENLLGQIALVLRLQIASPVYLVFKLVIVLLQYP